MVKKKTTQGRKRRRTNSTRISRCFRVKILPKRHTHFPSEISHLSRAEGTQTHTFCARKTDRAYKTTKEYHRLRSSFSDASSLSLSLFLCSFLSHFPEREAAHWIVFLVLCLKREEGTEEE